MPHRTSRPPSISLPITFDERPIVVGVTPGQPELVVRTAANLALALGVRLVCAYVDAARHVIAELPGGDVRHEALEPDALDDTWQRTDAALRTQLAGVLGRTGAHWEFHYLAGLPWRALTHLARAVDASTLVVGARTGPAATVRGFLDSAVSARLAHHQHRPVVVVPLAPVDWKGRTPWQ